MGMDLSNGLNKFINCAYKHYVLCACTYRNRFNLYSICELVEAIPELLASGVQAKLLNADTPIVAVRNRRVPYA